MIKRTACLFLALLTVLSLGIPALGDGAPAEPAVSSAASAGKAAAKLPAPKIRSASCSVYGAQLAWDPVPGAVQYRVYYKTAAGKWQRIGATSATVLIWAGAKSGTRYTFTVRAFDSAGRGGYYDAKGRTLTYVAAPVIRQVSSTASGVKIQWDRVPGASLYRVFYKTPGGWKRAGDASGTSFTWTKAQSGAGYTFTVRCLGADKKTYVSAYDPAGRTLDYLAQPAIRRASCAAGGVQLTWDAVPGAAGYRVFYKTAGGWKRVGDTTGTSLTWGAAKSGTKYTFTVRCVSAGGTEYTSSYDAAGKTVTYIAAPSITRTASTAQGMELAWDPAPGAARYRVFYKAPGGWSRLGDTSDTSFTWAGAQYGVTYTFTVRCLDAAGKRFTSAYDAAGTTATYGFQAARPLDNIGKVSGLDQEDRGCCMATSFSMAANLILGRDEYGAFDWTATNSDALNVSTSTTLAGSDGYTYRPYWKDAGSADGLRAVIDAALADGCPIIISVQNRSTASTHYVVAVGWADEAHSDYLIADPAIAGGPMTGCAVPMAGNRNYSLGNKNGTFVYLAFSRS